MAGTFFVYPTSESQTCEHCGSEVPPQWAVKDDLDGDVVFGPFDSRGEAKQAALDNRSDEAVVLLRADGTTHSEMRAAVVAAEPGQAVNGGSAEE